MVCCGLGQHPFQIILGIAVMVDALLVRLILVPIVLRLRWAAWWLPRWLYQLLRTFFGH